MNRRDHNDDWNRNDRSSEDRYRDRDNGYDMGGRGGFDRGRDEGIGREWPGDRYGSDSRYGNDSRYGSSDRQPNQRFGGNDWDYVKYGYDRDDRQDRDAYREYGMSGSPRDRMQRDREGYSSQGPQGGNYDQSRMNDRTSGPNQYGQSNHNNYSQGLQGGSYQRGDFQGGRFDDSLSTWRNSQFPADRSNRFGQNDERSFDGQPRGEHYGKGPKGWKRNEDRTRDEICEAIANQGDIDASDVDVKMENGEVVLSGTIANRNDKRRLEALVERLHGVEDVRNELRVKKTTTDTSRSNDHDNKAHGRNARAQS